MTDTMRYQRYLRFIDACLTSFGTCSASKHVMTADDWPTYVMWQIISERFRFFAACSLAMQPNYVRYYKWAGSKSWYNDCISQTHLSAAGRHVVENTTNIQILTEDLSVLSLFSW